LFTTSAALVKLPVSAMAMNVRSWSASSNAVMGDSLADRGIFVPPGITSRLLIGQIKNIRFTNQYRKRILTVLAGNRVQEPGGPPARSERLTS